MMMKMRMMKKKGKDRQSKKERVRVREKVRAGHSSFLILIEVVNKRENPCLNVIRKLPQNRIMKLERTACPTAGRRYLAVMGSGTRVCQCCVCCMLFVCCVLCVCCTLCVCCMLCVC